MSTTGLRIRSSPASPLWRMTCVTLLVGVGAGTRRHGPVAAAARDPAPGVRLRRRSSRRHGDLLRGRHAAASRERRLLALAGFCVASWPDWGGGRSIATAARASIISKAVAVRRSAHAVRDHHRPRAAADRDGRSRLAARPRSRAARGGGGRSRAGCRDASAFVQAKSAPCWPAGPARVSPRSTTCRWPAACSRWKCCSRPSRGPRCCPPSTTSAIAAAVAWIGLGNEAQYRVPVFDVEAVADRLVAGGRSVDRRRGLRVPSTRRAWSRADGDAERMEVGRCSCVIVFAAIGWTVGLVPAGPRQRQGARRSSASTASLGARHRGFRVAAQGGRGDGGAPGRRARRAADPRAVLWRARSPIVLGNAWSMPGGRDRPRAPTR